MTNVVEVYVPTPSLPYQHGAYDAIGTASHVWLTGYGFQQHAAYLKVVDTPLFVARCLPYARPHQFRLACDILSWAFLYDDHIARLIAQEDNGTATRCLDDAQRLADTPAATEVHPCPLLAPLRDVMARYQDTCSYGPFSLMTSGFRRWLSSTGPGQHIDPADPVNSYLALRGGEATGWWLTRLSPIAGEYHVPEADWADPRMSIVSDILGVAAGIDNDLVSHQGETSTTVLDCLSTADGLRGPSFVAAAVDIRDAAVCRLEQIINDFTAEGHKGSARYAAHAMRWIRGNNDWATRTARYTTRANDAGLAPTVTLQCTGRHPRHNCNAPPAYPAIAWWWDQSRRMPTGKDLGNEDRLPRRPLSR